MTPTQSLHVTSVWPLLSSRRPLSSSFSLRSPLGAGRSCLKDFSSCVFVCIILSYLFPIWLTLFMMLSVSLVDPFFAHRFLLRSPSRTSADTEGAFIVQKNKTGDNCTVKGNRPRRLKMTKKCMLTNALGQVFNQCVWLEATAAKNTALTVMLRKDILRLEEKVLTFKNNPTTTFTITGHFTKQTGEAHSLMFLNHNLP